jgi:hypothetical protein
MVKNSIRQSIESVFGKNVLDHALFYENEGSLRFELSEGGSYAEMFFQAYVKASELLGAVFEEQEEVHACIGFYGEKKLLGSLSVFRGIRECQITIPKSECEIWQGIEPKEELLRTYIVFPVQKGDLPKLLWSALASDLGVRPRANCDVYLFSIKQGILVHPYDDRGMDVIGPNKAFLQSLFNKYKHYLLEYDMAVMERQYGIANK